VLAGDFMEPNVPPQFTLNLGGEFAIAYDLVDFRLTTHWTFDPEFLLDLSFGFPFRYKPKPNIAIIALDKIMTIHTDGDRSRISRWARSGLPGGAAVRGRRSRRGHHPGINTDIIVIPATVVPVLAQQDRPGGEFTLGTKPRARASTGARCLFMQARFWSAIPANAALATPGSRDWRHLEHAICPRCRERFSTGDCRKRDAAVLV
jgi:hypothetical protein